MRIAVFIKSTTFHKGYGGLETQNKSLCEGLVGRGYDLIVFSPQKELQINEKISNGVTYKFVPCNFRFLLGFAHLDKNNWVNKSREYFIKEHNKKPFAIVMGQSAAAAGVIRKKDSIGAKVISISHGTILSEFKTAVRSVSNFADVIKLIPASIYVFRNFFTRQREFVLHSDKVVAVSENVKKALIDETFISDDRVEVIYNGIDGAKFDVTYKKSNSGRVKLVYFGRLDKSKGLQILFKAIDTKGFENVELHVIGEGDYFDSLKNISEGLSIKNQIYFHGRLSHEQIISTIGNYDIFVFPSLRLEGFPMTLPEAMFSGLPVIVSDIGGLPEAVEDGKTGFVIKVKDINLLREKLLILVNNPILRAEFGVNAKQKAKREFSLDVMLDRYEKVICEVLE